MPPFLDSSGAIARRHFVSDFIEALWEDGRGRFAPREFAAPDTDDAAVKVAHTARLLDHIAPGWARRINPVTLNLCSPYCCILGQVFGGEYSYADALQVASGYRVAMDHFPELHSAPLGVFSSNQYVPFWLTEAAARL